MIDNIDNEISKENNKINDEIEVGDESEIEGMPSEENFNDNTSEGNEKEESLDKDNLKLLKKELEDTKDKLLRSLAENENTRKQMDKTRQEGIKYGVQPLAREIINIVDNFDRAFNTKSELNEKALEEGFLLIKKDILNILDKFNIIKINALGESFDANYHQAMFEKETKDYEEGKVCEIIQEGYSFHDRLLRPVLVGVAKKETEVQKETEKE
ncbi:nucleotide exchange factor GrpE [Pelagibacteraceae bacterium]|nr:nucleotide exchange factor GrpE [Pelagibacteraceae bacterium]